MSALPGWTPASRPGIVPLHPLSFGTILGRSFTALRQNPRLLLGFALIVQTAAYIVTILAVGGVAIWAFSRLDTVPYDSDDWNTLFIGSTVIVLLAALVLGLASTVVTIVVQAVVVVEVSAEVVAERLTLREAWARVRPAVGRLLAWTLLAAVAVVLAVGVLVALLIAIGVVVAPLAVVLGIVLALGAIPLWVWLSTRLLLVPSVIILEGATIRGALRRSWRLTQRRFWNAFGVVFVVQAIFGVLAQIVSLPLSLAGSFLSAIFAPTGDPDVGAIVTLIVSTVATQMLVLLVTSVQAIVLSTATALVYVDCRMRHEGLDLDLQQYVERRDAGATDLPDPFREHIGREIAPRTGWAGYPAGSYPGYLPGSSPGYPGSFPGYPPAGYPATPGGYPTPPTIPSQPAAPPPYAASTPPLPPYAAPWPPAAAPAASPAPPSAPPPPPTPGATSWTAPGTSDEPDPETPWR